MNSKMRIWGLPLSLLTLPQAVDAIVTLIRSGKPSYAITANTHYAMLSYDDPGLREVNAGAAFIVADGAPLVWASRRRGSGLPERVAGSDLIFALCERAAREGYRLFFLGGAEGVADEASRRLCHLYPGLHVAGTACPPYRELTAGEHERLLETIRAASPDILILAYSMPRGERWIAANGPAVNVPVCINLGASIDFAAGLFRRAPLRLQRCGLEWAFRLWLEPRRLFPRYFRNAKYILRMVIHDLASKTRDMDSIADTGAPVEAAESKGLLA
jgi:N-acetylglucosaminyldiphosphoundecaprenol N-acetyl-beta-D-mannosaminyltransferase